MFALSEPALLEIGVTKIGDRLYLVDCLQSLHEVSSPSPSPSP